MLQNFVIFKGFLKKSAIILKYSNKQLCCKKCLHLQSVCFTGNNNNTVNKQNVYRAMFFGSDKFALRSLEQLYEQYELKKLSRLEIVTNYKGDENCLTKFATMNNIKVHKWPVEVESGEFDIGLVVSFGHLLSQRIIEAFPLGMLNVHASLLPRWRGAAPIFYTLKHGDKETGVSVMKIKPKKVDIGEIVATAKIDIADDDVYPVLHDKLADLGADLLINTLNRLPEVLNSAKPQGEDGATYAPKISAESAFVSWNSMTATDVCNLQKALTSLYTISTKYKDFRIKLFNVAKLEKPPQTSFDAADTPGLVIYDKPKRSIDIQCKDNTWISVKKLTVIGRKPMSADGFNNGFIAGPKLKYLLLHG